MAKILGTFNLPAGMSSSQIEAIKAEINKKIPTGVSYDETIGGFTFANDEVASLFSAKFEVVNDDTSFEGIEIVAGEGDKAGKAIIKIGKVAAAKEADHAVNADNATNATNATNAVNATNAKNYDEVDGTIKTKFDEIDRVLDSAATKENLNKLSETVTGHTETLKILAETDIPRVEGKANANAEAITALQTKLGSMEGATIYIGRTEIVEPTAEQLNAFATEAGIATLISGHTIIDGDGNEWRYETTSASWVNLGYSAVNVATNDMLGVVKGKVDGDVQINTDGTMTVSHATAADSATNATNATTASDYAEGGAIDTKIKAIEKSVNDHAGEYNTLSNKVTDIEGEIDGLEAAIAAKTNTVTEIDGSTETNAEKTDTALLADIATPKTGDIAIIKRLIGGSAPSYTGYVYNTNHWAVMDGNVSADNVYFNNDLLTTAAIGNISLSGGQATIAAKGENLTSVWEKIFVKETKTGLKTADPSAQASYTHVYKEVGTEASADVTLSLKDDGEYKYGYTSVSDAVAEQTVAANTITNNKTTGVAVKSGTAGYALNVTNGTATQNADNPNKFTVSAKLTAKGKVTVTGTVNYNQGAIPVSNLKKAYPAQRIPEGNKGTGAKDLMTYYVPMYWGYKVAGTELAIDSITGAQIKALGNTVVDANAYAETKPTAVAATASWRQFFVAVPTSYTTSTPTYTDGNGLPCTVEKKATAVELDFNGTKITYDVYYIANTANYDTLAGTLSW